MSFEVPILLLTFNRPDLTKRIISELALISPRKLYFVSDGPRFDNFEDHLKVNETRDLISIINWDCRVFKLFRNENLGCKYSVSTAIDWFFEMEEFGIILEDDCLPSHSFFLFCKELLIRFRDNDQVGLITGQSRIDVGLLYNYDYFFSKYATIWGWASWRRVWKDYDVNMSDWPVYRSIALNSIVNKQSRNYWDKIFKNVYKGNVDTWDYQLVYLLLKNNLKTIVPKVNLISNIGFDERATHTTDLTSEFANLEKHEIIMPLRHNDFIEVDTIDTYLEKKYFRNPLITEKIIKRVENSLKRFKHKCLKGKM